MVPSAPHMRSNQPVGIKTACVDKRTSCEVRAVCSCRLRLAACCSHGYELDAPWRQGRQEVDQHTCAEQAQILRADDRRRTALVSLRRYMRMGGKLILHSTSRGAASGSVGRPVPRGSEGSVGVGTGRRSPRDRDLRRSPTLKIPPEAGRTGLVGRSAPGRDRARAGDRVGRSGTLSVKSTSHPHASVGRATGPPRPEWSPASPMVPHGPQ